jgi:hypothetical protein
MRQSVRTLSAVVAGLGVLILATAPLGATQQATHKETTAKLLFAVNAASGSFTPTGQKEEYTLTLAGVSPETVWFTDRPARQADSVPTATALDMIGFTEDGEGPPNAVVTFHADAMHHAVAVILNSPVYNAPAGTMTFQTQLLRKPDQGLAGFNQRLDRSPPLTFTSASLFIDDQAVTIGSDGQPIPQAQPPATADTRVSISVSLAGIGQIANIRAVHGEGNLCVRGANNPGDIPAGKGWVNHELSVIATSGGSCDTQPSIQKWAITDKRGAVSNVRMYKTAGYAQIAECTGDSKSTCKSIGRQALTVCMSVYIGLHCYEG